MNLVIGCIAQKVLSFCLLFRYSFGGCLKRRNMKRIAIFGGSFNPPGIHHINIVKKLSHYFDEVVVVPCGARPDKPEVELIASRHRANMARMAFGNLSKMRIDFLDLKKNIFRRTHELEDCYKNDGELWHVVGGDIIARGREGQSIIHRVWEKGPEMWKKLRFAVFPREGIQFSIADLPPKNEIYYLERHGSSSQIREKIMRHEPVAGLLDFKMEKYIFKNKLYA